MYGLGAATTDPAPNDPTAIAGDYQCADTAADASPGQLGMLAQLLRQLVDKLLPPWISPPAGFQAFDAQGLIALPAIGVTSTVLTLPVPQGYNCVVRRLSCNFIGPGFVQASGSLIWQVTVDDAPYKNYGNIQVELGSVGPVGPGPRPTDGILANSGQVIKFLLNNVSLVAGGTNTVCTLGGWFYPARRKRGVAR